MQTGSPGTELQSFQCVFNSPKLAGSTCLVSLHSRRVNSGIMWTGCQAERNASRQILLVAAMVLNNLMKGRIAKGTIDAHNLRLRQNRFRRKTLTTLSGGAGVTDFAAGTLQFGGWFCYLCVMVWLRAELAANEVVNDCALCSVN